MPTPNAEEAARANITATARTTSIVVAVVMLFVVTAMIAFVAREVLLLIFLAVLLAAGLCGSAEWVPFKARIPYGVRLAVVCITLMGLSLLFVVAFGYKLEQQLGAASQQLQKSRQVIGKALDDYPSLKSVLGLDSGTESNRNSETADEEKDSHSKQESNGESKGQSPEESDRQRDRQQNNGTMDQLMTMAESHLKSDNSAGIGEWSSRFYEGMSSFFTTTFGMLANLFFVILVGVFIAVSPRTYRDGALLLVPGLYAERARGLADQLYDTIWHWMIGRAATMAITGTGIGVVLAMIGVPMALLLGVLTALLTFIPNIGGIVALLVAVIFAAPLGTGTVIAVVVAYCAVQFLESNVITPLIQQQQVAVPPAVLISFQFVMAAAFGILGVMVAEPAIAILMLLVRKLYVEAEPQQAVAETG